MTIPFDDNWVNSAETRKQNRILLKSKQGGRRCLRASVQDGTAAFTLFR